MKFDQIGIVHNCTWTMTRACKSSQCNHCSVTVIPKGVDYWSWFSWDDCSWSSQLDWVLNGLLLRLDSSKTAGSNCYELDLRHGCPQPYWCPGTFKESKVKKRDSCAYLGLLKQPLQLEADLQRKRLFQSWILHSVKRSAHEILFFSRSSICWLRDPNRRHRSHAVVSTSMDSLTKLNKSMWHCTKSSEESYLRPLTFRQSATRQCLLTSISFKTTAKWWSTLLAEDGCCKDIKTVYSIILFINIYSWASHNSGLTSNSFWLQQVNLAQHALAGAPHS